MDEFPALCVLVAAVATASAAREFLAPGGPAAAGWAGAQAGVDEKDSPAGREPRPGVRERRAGG
ncbi:MAG TPA: hypothetical protein PKC26_12685, partial [Plasticicumulans sp.]|nr:hypothetical protein [Plasticicumulans sp.]